VSIANAPDSILNPVLSQYDKHFGARITQKSERLFVDDFLFPLLGKQLEQIIPQHPFLDSTGRSRRIDFAYVGDGVKLALEVNGETYHAEGVIPNAFETTMPWRATVLAACLLLACVASAGTRYKVLHDFGAGNDGRYPAGGLVMGGDGNLYGATGGVPAGCNGQGTRTLFRLKWSGKKWRQSILYCFAGEYIDGIPNSGLIVDGSGDLFGTADSGPGGLGDIFELMPGGEGWDFNIIYPRNGGCCLVPDKAGDIYGSAGMGKYNHGAIGELTPGSDGWTYTDLYDFCPPPRYCKDGLQPESALAWDTQGNLYGTMLEGGNNRCSGGCGVAFQMTPNGDGTWTYHVIHYFGSFKNDGTLPVAGLVLDAAGNAYGATWGGGPNNCGIVYELQPAGRRWKEKVLYNFPGLWGSGGCGVVDTLALDPAGNLYGMTLGGDKRCGPCGLIFKLSPQKSGKWKYSALHIFHGPEGAGPYGVILDSKGNIFGTTFQGGKYDFGVAFEITP